MQYYINIFQAHGTCTHYQTMIRQSPLLQRVLFLLLLVPTFATQNCIPVQNMSTCTQLNGMYFDTDNQALQFLDSIANIQSNVSPANTTAETKSMECLSAQANRICWEGAYMQHTLQTVGITGVQWMDPSYNVSWRFFLSTSCTNPNTNTLDKGCASDCLMYAKQCLLPNTTDPVSLVSKQLLLCLKPTYFDLLDADGCHGQRLHNRLQIKIATPGLPPSNATKMQNIVKDFLPLFATMLQWQLFNVRPIHLTDENTNTQFSAIEIALLHENPTFEIWSHTNKLFYNKKEIKDMKAVLVQYLAPYHANVTVENLIMSAQAAVPDDNGFFVYQVMGSDLTESAGATVVIAIVVIVPMILCIGLVYGFLTSNKKK